MKTKGFKLISLVLMLSLLLSVLSLSACTDDEPRTLDSVEQSIVGIWKRATSDRIFYFNSDGTWEAPGYVDKRFVNSTNGLYSTLNQINCTVL